MWQVTGIPESTLPGNPDGSVKAILWLTAQPNGSAVLRNGQMSFVSLGSVRQSRVHDHTPFTEQG